MLAFKKRIPRSWWEVRRIRDKMRRLAERIAKAESREAIRDLSKRLQALQDTLSGSFRVKGATDAQARTLGTRSWFEGFDEHQNSP